MVFRLFHVQTYQVMFSQGQPKTLFSPTSGKPFALLASAGGARMPLTVETQQVEVTG